MDKKFDVIIEGYMDRYQNNTFATGDRVKFVNNYLNHDWIKQQPGLKIDRLKEMVESGDFIRVCAIKSLKPVTAQAGHFDVVDEVYYDIVREKAPGLYTLTMTVPQGLLEIVDDGINISGPTPDNQIKQDPSHIEPREVNVGDDELGPVKQTASKDQDHQLLGQNVNISVARPANSYTAKYMES